jgi:tRNA (uracil-5-)-methyltransferase
VRGASLLNKEIEITGLNDDGEGIASVGESKIIVPYTAPGDLITLNRVFRKKGKWLCLDFELLKPSIERVVPVCAHFGRAGGCSLQHLNYNFQVKFKHDKLKEALAEFYPQIDFIPAEITSGYRNRLDLAITDRGIGFRQKGQWWNVVDVDACILASEKLGVLVGELKAWMSKHDLKPYNQRDQSGFLRYIVIREGKFTNEVMVNLVTAEGEMPGDVAQAFSATSLYWSVNSGLSDLSEGEIKQFWGNEFLTEELNGAKYQIHPNSFFQANSYLATQLLAHVVALAKGSKILDLYCGVGTFALQFAKVGKEVVGSDINPFSIELATKNAALNGLEVAFEAMSDTQVTNLYGADTVVVDPPRVGLHKDLKKFLLAERPQQIIYVSCNPKSLAVDLAELTAAYDIQSITGFDMFPHTPHVETVVNLHLR